jgi:hypothetical protein
MSSRSFSDDASLVEMFAVEPVAAGTKEKVVAQLVSLREQAAGLIDAWHRYLVDINSQISLSRTWVDQEIEISHSRMRTLELLSVNWTLLPSKS